MLRQRSRGGSIIGAAEAPGGDGEIAMRNAWAAFKNSPLIKRTDVTVTDETILGHEAVCHICFCLFLSFFQKVKVSMKSQRDTEQIPHVAHRDLHAGRR